MDANTTSIAPIRKTVDVPWSVEAAFDRFTTGLGAWWPLDTHSVGRDKTTGVTMEGRVDGQLYETQSDSTRCAWGTVTIWEPPARVAFTWHPGREPDGAQKVEVTFHARPEGGARVELVHRGWERLGDRGAEVREGYVSGWDGVLALYVDAEID
jgi:hypothetical protein